MSKNAIMKILVGDKFDITTPYAELVAKEDNSDRQAENVETGEIVDQEKFTPILFNLANQGLKIYQSGDHDRALKRVQTVIGRYGMEVVRIHEPKQPNHVIKSICDTKVRSYYFSRIGVFVEYEIDGTVYGLKDPSCNTGLVRV